MNAGEPVLRRRRGRTALRYCFTRTEGDHSERIGHYGPHQVGLGLVLHHTDPSFNARWVLERAISEVQNYVDASDTYLDTIRPVLTRPEVTPYFVEVTDEEATALRRLLAEAQEIWVTEQYSRYELDEDRLLGNLAESGMVAALGLCLDLRPVEMP